MTGTSRMKHIKTNLAKLLLGKKEPAKVWRTRVMCPERYSAAQVAKRIAWLLIGLATISYLIYLIITRPA